MTYPGTSVTFAPPVAQKERITILDSLRGFITPSLFSLFF